jgi:hypothetical protein
MTPLIGAHNFELKFAIKKEPTIISRGLIGAHVFSPHRPNNQAHPYKLSGLLAR